MKYRAKGNPIQAVRLHDIALTYEKWGGTQHSSVGDWLIGTATEAYTCEASVFEATYQPVTDRPGWFRKVAIIEATIASDSGTVSTLEGESAYAPGDFIVTNPGGDRYPVSAATFEAKYEAA